MFLNSDFSLEVRFLPASNISGVPAGVNVNLADADDLLRAAVAVDVVLADDHAIGVATCEFVIKQRDSGKYKDKTLLLMWRAHLCKERQLGASSFTCPRSEQRS